MLYTSIYQNFQMGLKLFSIWTSNVFGVKVLTWKLMTNNVNQITKYNYNYNKIGIYNIKN